MLARSISNGCARLALGQFSNSLRYRLYGERHARTLLLLDPFGDVSLNMGPIVFCLGSNRFEKVRATYGKADVDRDMIEGHFSDDPIEIVEKFGGHWATTTFSVGDLIIFNMFLMHASLVNTSNKIRITADTRYQLASEPIDERWVGEKPKGHYAWKQQDAKIEPLEESRQRWGV